MTNTRNIWSKLERILCGEKMYNLQIKSMGFDAVWLPFICFLLLTGLKTIILIIATNNTHPLTEHLRRSGYFTCIISTALCCRFHLLSQSSGKSNDVPKSRGDWKDQHSNPSLSDSKANAFLLAVPANHVGQMSANPTLLCHYQPHSFLEPSAISPKVILPFISCFFQITPAKF